MYENEKLLEELNDLKLINSERIEKYKKELEKTKDSEYISLFKRMIRESMLNKEELVQEMKRKEPGQSSKKLWRTGNIYKTWTDSIPSAGKNISEMSEIIELATQKAYESALSSDIYIPSHIASLIIMHKAKLKESYQLLLKKQNLILENS